ncbi:hypothetical protein Q3G72_014295 [Acer saccharum]|nr:hypothetical protein Q3G72_014295 [Acer saccharum]
MKKKRKVEQTFQADPGPRLERWERNGLRLHFLLLARMRTQAKELHSIDLVGLVAANETRKATYPVPGARSYRSGRVKQLPITKPILTSKRNYLFCSVLDYVKQFTTIDLGLNRDGGESSSHGVKKWAELELPISEGLGFSTRSSRAPRSSVTVETTVNAFYDILFLATKAFAGVTKAYQFVKATSLGVKEP